MKRILVIGSSGSGKTAVARQISEQVGLPFFPSDPFYWAAGWRPTSHELINQHVAEVIRRKEWVLDGNFVQQEVHYGTRI